MSLTIDPAIGEFSPTREQLEKMTRAERDLLYHWRMRRTSYDPAEHTFRAHLAIRRIRRERGLPH